MNRTALAWLAMGMCALVGSAIVIQPLVPVAVVWIALTATVALHLSVERFLAIAICLRTLTDSRFVPETVGFLANVLLAGLIVLVALILVERRRAKIGKLAVILMAMITLWSGITVARAGGFDADALNEAVRFLSIVGLAIIAGSVGREASREQVATLIVWASIPALLLIIVDRTLLIGLNLASDGNSFGTFANKNVAAAYIAVLLVYSLYKYTVSKRSVFLVGICLSIGALVFTVSLGGFSAAFLGSLVLILLLSRRIPAYIQVLGFIAIVVATIVTLRYTPIADRIAQIEATGIYAARAGEQTTSINWRLSNWQRLIEEWRIHPFMGWGFGSTSGLVQPLGKQPHSELVRYLVEFGIVGFTALAGAFGMIVRRAFHDNRSSPLLLALIVTVVVNGMVSNTLAYVAAIYLLVVIWNIEDQASTNLSSVPDVCPN